MSDVRPATPDDIPELIRLRGLMFASFTEWGEPPAGGDWRAACADAMAGYLDGDRLRIFVIDAEEGLAACGIGAIDHRLPSPYNPRGTVGHLFGMVTDPRHRKRGHARAIVAELLRWFDDQGVGRVDLTASRDGIELYRGFGFAESPDPFMKRMKPWTPGD